MISSVANSRIKQVVLWQTKAKERKKSDIFIVEGIKMYEEAPESWVQETYVSQKLMAELENSTQQSQKDLMKRLKKVGAELVTDEVFAKMSDTQTPQGILCVLKRPKFILEDMLEPKSEKQAPLLVILEDLQDPGNLGTIIRTGEGAGIHGVIMTKDTVDIYNPKTIRATMGSIYRVPHIYIEDLPSILEQMAEKNIHTLAASLDGKKYYDSFDFKEGTAFLIGNEGNGLRQETQKLAENYLKIPMEGQVESLNAAIATSLLMYEAHRQRNL